jgi:Tfp pilus assembly protein PilX/cytoskeletal protein CcmA (bactofilin family)
LLVINRLRAANRNSDESGAVLVTVVILMFVMFVIAASVAASVVFTAGANAGNKDRTVAFIAAESGRDTAIARIATSCADTFFDSRDPLNPAYDADPAGPTFEATVFTTTGVRPATSVGLTQGCPSAATTFVVVNSVGTGPDGATASIDSVYEMVPPQAPTGGSLAYFGGGVGLQKSIYNGDLVVRTGAFTCALGTGGQTITGDLWVLNGPVTLNQDCHITGSVYAAGEVKASSSGVSVGGDIVTESGKIELASNGVVVGGDIHSGSSVELKGTGPTTGTVGHMEGTVLVGGQVTARTTAAVDAVKWKRADGSPITVQLGPVPDFNPELDDVYDMTTWMDLGRTSWGATQQIMTGCPTNPTSLLPGTGKLLIDYTSCPMPPDAVTITIDAVTVNRDVVFLVPATATMKVKFDGNVSSSGPIESAPQLVFVHVDRNETEIVPPGQTTPEPWPDCESSGPDDLTTKAGVTSIAARVMVYTPCAIGGTVRVSYTGQFFTGTNSIGFGAGAAIDCTEMAWPPLFDEISCYIAPSVGSPGPPPAPTLGDLVYQTER